MQMQMTTNSAIVWKRKADESEQSAKLLARISILLLLLMLVTGAYAFSAHNRVSELCASLQAKSTEADSLPARKLGLDTVNAYCH